MSEEVNDINGVIDFIKEPSTKTAKIDGTPMKQPLHSIGIKLADGSWHNIQSFDSQEKCKEVLNKEGGGVFVKGDSVVLTIESKDGKYPHIVAITMADKIATEVVQTNEEIAKEQSVSAPMKQTTWNKDSDILLAVAFKGAVEIVTSATAKLEVVDMAESATHTLDATEILFKGLKKAKLSLQESGDW